jgi:ferric enterobactin receptor
MIKMSPLKLVTLPNLGEKDILRSLQLMPGISAANENSSGLYVRGGTPDQVLVLYDGFTVYNVEHLFGFFSAFNSNAIKDVQLFKGGFDAKYGGRLAGVAEITGKEGDQKKFNFSGDLSLMSINAFAEMPIGDKASGIIAVRRSWSSPIYDKIFEQFVSENETSFFGRNGSAPTQETASYFYDLNARFTYRPSDKDVLSLSIYTGEDDLDNSIMPQTSSRFSGTTIDIETKDITNWGNTGASLKWSRRFSPKLYMNTLISYSNYFSVRDRSTSGTFVGRSGSQGAISRPMHEDNNLNDFTYKSDFEFKWNKNQQIEFGFQTTYNDIDYTYSQYDTITIIDRSTSGTIYSGYLQDKLTLFNNKLNITAGMRYNYFTGTSQSYYEPRINGILQLTNKLKLKASAGRYYQFAKRVIREDITEGSRDFWVLSDDDKLPVSSSLQYVVGASYETKDYLFDVGAYYKELSNITEYSLRINADRTGISYDENFFTGSGIAKGIDFLFQKKYGKYTGWIGYTLGEVTNNIPAYGDYDFYAANDVTNELKIIQSYQYRNWYFGVTWIYATGRPYTAPEGGYQLTLLDGTFADFINVSVKNGNRLPDYHRLDLSATYSFKFGTSPATLSFSIFNVFNRTNVWYKEYEIIENEVIETPVNYLGITPNINLTFKLR